MNREGAKGKRGSPVEQAEVSESAKRKHRTKKTEEEFSVHSFSTLMEDLGTLSLNEVTPPGSPEHRSHICAESAALQQRASELLSVEPGRIVPSTATG